MEDQDIEVGAVDHKQRLLDEAKKIEEGRAGEPEERAELPEIAVEGEGESDDERDDLDQVADEPRATRAERRGNRFTEAQRTAAEAQQRYEQERARSMALEAQLMASRQPAQPQASLEQRRAEAEAEYRRDLNALQRARMDLQQVIAANRDNFTAEVEQRVMHEDANLRLFEAHAQRKYFGRMDEIERPPPAPPQDFVFESLRAKYQDVDQNQPARQVFVANLQQAQQKNPNRSRAELIEEAFQKAQAWLRGEAWSPATRERGKPTASTKAKFTGTAAGSASNGPPQSQRATITKEEDKMAQKLYSHIPEPSERRRLYYKNVKAKQLG